MSFSAPFPLVLPLFACRHCFYSCSMKTLKCMISASKGLTCPGFLASEWLRPPGALFISRAGNRAKHCSYRVFRLSLCLITRVKKGVKTKEKMFFFSTHLCLDPTFLQGSRTLSFSSSFPHNSIALQYLSNEGYKTTYQALQYTRRVSFFSVWLL